MELKDRVKVPRTAVGTTQAKFAERMAISTSYISEIECGVEPNERAMRLIIAVYNVSEDWLRNGQGSMFQEDVSVAVSEAMRIFKSLDSHFQDGALKMLSTLAEINEREKSLLQQSMSNYGDKE
jgi:transcriptional regulator with XRE-family HTH domain